MRSAPSAAPGGSSGNDPLAELARLIGQNDPFAEHGRENARRAAQQPAPQMPAPAYADDRYAALPALDAPPHHQDFAPDDRQFNNYPPQYGAAPAYQARGPVPGYAPDAGYEHEAEYPTNAHSGADDHDFYDDAPPRRRVGIIAIAAIFGLAVIGTAGAFGYRAIFGSSGSKTPPPVIKADSSPTKIVPAANSKDPKSGKLIYDRVAERGQDEKLVSREEQPVEMNKPAGAAMPPDQNAGALQAPIGTGVVATEPKKVHTIAIRPDGTTMADATPTPAVASVSPPPAAAPSAPAPRATRTAVAAPAQIAPTQAAAPARAAAPVSNNAPLSLSPDAADQPAPPAPRATRTAVAAPTQIAPAQTAAPARSAPASIAPASGGGGGYAVQVSSQRSEADAQAAFRSLQAQYPSQLGGRQLLIHRVDLGAKGIYFRAMVGPLASDEASQLCSSLKAAGGQCIIQRN